MAAVLCLKHTKYFVIPIRLCPIYYAWLSFCSHSHQRYPSTVNPVV